MKSTGIRELKAHLSGYLREVATGETVQVTDRGRVVAELRPPGKRPRKMDPAADHYARLVEQGVIRQARKPRDGSWAKFAGLGAPAGAARALVDWDRGE